MPSAAIPTGPSGAAASYRGAKVLVLDADVPAGLACVQSLGRAGVSVHAALRQPGSPAEFTRWAAVRHRQPQFEPVEPALEWLLALDGEHAFTLVIPSSEGSLRWLRALPENHSLRLRAQLASDVAIDQALDKARTTQLAAQLGIPVPASQAIRQNEVLPPALGFPAVLKPARSKVVIGQRLASLSVAIARSPRDRQRILESWLPFTDVQEQAWVPGHGIGVEMLFERGRMIWSFMHERVHEYPLHGGGSTLRMSIPPREQLVEWSSLLMRKLNWHGVAMVEWRVAEDGSAHLMEINPRFWGSLPLTIAAGRNAPLDLLRMSLGQGVPAPGPYRIGVIARNPAADLRWFVANLRADHRDPMLLVEPVWRAALGWLRVLAGRETWDAWAWDDPRVLLHQATKLGGTIPRGLAKRATSLVASMRQQRHHRSVLRRLRARHGQPPRVLILCRGNICRSPFAELELRRRLPRLVVDSAGFHPEANRSTPEHVVHAARRFGIDMGACRSRALDQACIAAADLILVMDESNMTELKRRFPEGVMKATQLGMFIADSPEIADPYDMDPMDTSHVLATIEQAISGLLPYLA